MGQEAESFLHSTKSPVLLAPHPPRPAPSLSFRGSSDLPQTYREVRTLPQTTNVTSPHFLEVTCAHLQVSLSLPSVDILAFCREPSMSTSEGPRCPISHEAVLLPENHNIGSILSAVSPHSSDWDCQMSLIIVLCLLLVLFFWSRVQSGSCPALGGKSFLGVLYSGTLSGLVGLENMLF